MTDEERDIITQFIARVGGAPQRQGPFGGSVPATQPALPPVDREADALIAQQLQRYPEARYRIAQLAFVQEHALVEAQNRIKRLEWEVQQAQQAAQQAEYYAQQAAEQAQQRPSGGLFGGLFGGGRQQPPPPPRPGPQGGPWGRGGPRQPQYQSGPPPQPQYPPNYQQGMFQRQGGSGFLGSALTTAAGVAGGLVVGNALMGMFSGGGGMFGGGAASGATAGAVDQGTWSDPAGGATDPAFGESGSWDQPIVDDQSSWGDSGGGDGGGGWDSGGSSDDSF